jgi:class 3 adenylate cyclase
VREKSESVASAFALTRGSQTKDPRLAVHRTILVVDVEGFSDQRRTNAHQVAVRNGLYRVMRDAFGRAGISWDDCDREDRGDGVLVLVPAGVPKSLLVESLPTAMVVGLCEHNGAHPGPERIRLRMALHAGEVCYDEHGVTGASVNLTFRLLEAGPLKHALAGSPSVLAIIASSWFFEEVVRHSDAAAGYRRVDVAVKETTTTGWICLQDRTAAVPRPRRPSPPSRGRSRPRLAAISSRTLAHATVGTG